MLYLVRVNFQLTGRRNLYEPENPMLRSFAGVIITHGSLHDLRGS